VGGGKTLDTGKAVANNIKAASVIVPTIASTDAPTSSLVVIYNEDHVHEDVLFLPKNPDLVLVDSEIIAAAPVRFLVAGIGDAIATKYEAEACYKSDATNFQGGRCSVTALALAELCNDIILNHGISAKLSAENHLLTPSLEKVIEANILLSGLGFENGGEAVAHSFAGSLGLIPASNIAFHGEKVAVGVLIQLFLEDRPYKEIMELISFYRVIGLPTTLTELGWSEPSEEDLARVASKMCQPGSITHNMPFEVSETMVINAIKYLEHFQQDSNNVVTLENLG
ncbi:MAG: glycerol dehydrogenase, partial [Deltaproteobacteria bacterium]|nr:glycerol dehydrogenase [Deltaproteobacteria bacterium]